MSPNRCSQEGSLQVAVLRALLPTGAAGTVLHRCWRGAAGAVPHPSARRCGRGAGGHRRHPDAGVGGEHLHLGADLDGPGVLTETPSAESCGPGELMGVGLVDKRKGRVSPVFLPGRWKMSSLYLGTGPDVLHILKETLHLKAADQVDDRE